MRLASRDRVLVRLPSWLGDLVMAEPAVRALHERLAPGHLTLAAPRALLALLDGRFEGARRVAPDDLGAWRGHDVAFLLTGSFRSALLAWRAGIPERVGWARDLRGSLLTSSARPARERGGVPVGLGRSGRPPRVLPRPFGETCVELLGLAGVSVADTRSRLAADEAAHARVDGWLRSRGIGSGERFLLVNAGARAGSAKAVPSRTWATALDRIRAATGLPVAIVCGPGEEREVRALAAVLRRAGDVGHDSADPVLGLGELVAACERAALVLTSDSGPRHVATAVGADVVCVAGPTDPRHTADHLERTRLVRTVVPCGPCHLEACPLDGDEAQRCMHEIDPARIAVAAIELLSTANPDPTTDRCPASSPSSRPTFPISPSS